jgi:ubiquinol-cytochrome c reductase iron-sulfur subunit
VGAIATAVPFVTSFRPSARAQALGAPVEVDVSKLEVGALLKVEWRGRPIYILHRTEEMLGVLRTDVDLLADPNSEDSVQPSYATNEHRSIRPTFLVLEGVCTHLGCAPTSRGAGGLVPRFGGWVCPCHYSQYDISGRVRRGPAPSNLPVPPHTFRDEDTLVIG